MYSLLPEGKKNVNIRKGMSCRIMSRNSFVINRTLTTWALNIQVLIKSPKLTIYISI